MGSKIPMVQHLLVQCYLETRTPTKISILINSPYYFLEHVFIIIVDDDYRLLVIDNNIILWDKSYKTIKDAKIAFAKRFGYMAFNRIKEKQWSPQYAPDKDWLRDLLNMVSNCN